MYESSFNDCLINNHVISVSRDIARIKSLISLSKARVNYFSKLGISVENANFIFEAFYTSLLEVLHALVLSYGYKIKNHICLGFFLKDILRNEKIFRDYDNLRYQRNSLIYYGKEVNFKDIKKSIKITLELIKYIKSIIKI